MARFLNSFRPRYCSRVLGNRALFAQVPRGPPQSALAASFVNLQGQIYSSAYILGTLEILNYLAQRSELMGSWPSSPRSARFAVKRTEVSYSGGRVFPRAEVGGRSLTQLGKVRVRRAAIASVFEMILLELAEAGENLKLTATVNENFFLSPTRR